jgi:hypothetical protein
MSANKDIGVHGRHWTLNFPHPLLDGHALGERVLAKLELIFLNTFLRCFIPDKSVVVELQKSASICSLVLVPKPNNVSYRKVSQQRGPTECFSGSKGYRSGIIPIS